MKKVLVSFLITSSFIFALTVGQKAPTVVLSGENGGYISGGAWSSSSLKGKLHLLLYADPDKRKAMSNVLSFIKNNHFKNRLKTVAIINMKATWLPNFAIEKKLRSKQKELKNVVYVEDKNKYLVRKWGLKDNDTNIILFDKRGKVLYKHSGDISSEELKKLYYIIRKNL